MEVGWEDAQGDHTAGEEDEAWVRVRLQRERATHNPGAATVGQRGEQCYRCLNQGHRVKEC